MEIQFSGSLQFKNLKLSPHITNIYGGGGTVAKPCPALATPWTLVCQAPLSTGIPRQAYWSRLPFPSPTFSSLDFNATALLGFSSQVLLLFPSFSLP